MEEVDSEKKSQIVPKGEIPSISDQLLQSTERSSRPGSWKVRKYTICTADRQRRESSSEGLGTPDMGAGQPDHKHRSSEIQQGPGISQI